MKRNTFNRRLILHVLSEQLPDCGDNPPYPASSIHYTLECAFQNWSGIYQDMKTIPSIVQVHRTLKDLWHSGLIVGTRIKEEPCGNATLPSWVIRYQLSSEVERNYLIAKCSKIYRRVDKAKHGFNLFGAIIDMGLPSAEVAVLAQEVKALLQKTHPDKTVGLSEQFKQMIQCRDWIKSGIPLPTATHTAGETIQKQKSVAAN